MNGFDSLDKLDVRQEAAIAALLSRPTIAAAAKAAGVGEATLFRWLQEPAFQDAYRMARREVVGQAVANVQHSACDAVNVLKVIMNDIGNPPATRVRAAVAMLDIAFKAVEIEDLERRMAELEARLEGV